jgi:hypothetical protein
MSIATGSEQAVVLIVGSVLIVALGCAAALSVLEIDMAKHLRRRTALGFVERERDLAAAMSVPWRTWLVIRATVLVGALMLGLMAGVATLAVLLLLVALFGVRFALAGRAAKRRLAADRAFLAQMHIVRDRIGVANQSLDTALQDVARNPGRELAYILAPFQQSGSTSANIVACASRSRSAVIECACAVMLWSRTRSLDALLDVMDHVLFPVAEAQLALEEESLVTLSQQRAVSFAMAGLMLFMFLSIVRVDSFRVYYQTATGTIVLLLVVVLFAALLALLGKIARVATWTRWNVGRMAQEERSSHA